MRIVQMLDSLYVGGSQKMQLFLVETLLPLGIEITVIDLSNSKGSPIYASLRAAGVEVVSFPFKRLYSPRTFARLTQFLSIEKFDLLNTYLTYSNIIGGFAGKLSGTPVIASLRSARFAQADYSAKRYALEKLALRYAARYVLVNGEAVAQFARQRLGDTPKIKVITNAVDVHPSITVQERQVLRTTLLPSPTDGLLILSVGRLTEAKGFPDLFNAFHRVAVRHPSARLVIAGEGPLRGTLEAQIHSLGLEDKIYLLGERKDIYQLMAAADVYVNASLWEGTPVSILEAMAASLPIVATDAGETPYLLEGGAGLVVPHGQPEAIASALDLLLEDPQRRCQLGTLALERVKTCYRRDVWRRNLLELYGLVTPKAQEYLNRE